MTVCYIVVDCLKISSAKIRVSLFFAVKNLFDFVSNCQFISLGSGFDVDIVEVGRITDHMNM